MGTELVQRGEGAIVAVPQENKITAMLQAVVDSGITAESAAAMKELAILYRQEQAHDARLAFNRALNAMQRELPTVDSTRSVPDRNGNTKFVYASYEDIWGQVAPVLFRHGFSVGFNMKVADNRVVVTCTLTHDGGHERSNECAVRIGGGAPGLSGGQEDGAAETSAKRRAFCAAINVPLNKDKDALVDGATINPGLAAEIEARVRAIVGDSEAAYARWLSLGGVASFADLREAKADVVLAQLTKEESKSNAPACPKEYVDWAEQIGLAFEKNGKSPSDCSAWLASAATKRGAKSAKDLTEAQRAEIWQAVHKPVGTVGHKK